MCFKIYKNFNLVTPLINNNRCLIRYKTLLRAKMACILESTCMGIVDDSGLFCDNINYPFELRKNSTLEISIGTTTWLKIACERNNISLIVILISLALIIILMYKLFYNNRTYTPLIDKNEGISLESLHEKTLPLQQPHNNKKSLEIL